MRPSPLTLAACAIPAFALAAYAAETTIVQAGQAFSQTEITIAAGDHLKFANQDDVKHNIVVEAADDEDNSKDMGVQPPGGSVVVPFDKAGAFNVRCHIHPDMLLHVTVK